MNKGHDMPMLQNGGSITLEMMIPGNKAGIVIGKGGETIKQLQVTHLCMYFIASLNMYSSEYMPRLHTCQV